MGARYYLEGIYRAERDGMGDPCPDELPDCVWDKSPFYFYDPIARETVYMIGELVLNIRSDSSGEIIMQHMWTSSDRGFPLIGAQSEIFKKIHPADSSIDG